MITIDDPDLERLARELAVASGVTVPDLLRGLLREREAAGRSEIPSPWAMLDRLAGSIEGPPDWASEHDHHLYGTPKRREP